MDAHDMNWKCLLPIVIGLLAAGLGPIQKPGWGQSLAGKEGLPCYVVIGTDVSSSMNENDPLIQDASGNRHALRNEAQLTFLRLLPFVHSKSYVGVVQFAESITHSQPGKEDQVALVPWQDTQPDGEILKKLVPPIEPQVHWGTLVHLGMDWAGDRIRLARKVHGDGPGIFILLTDGDPDNAANELSGQTRQVMDAVERLAAANIHVCPVIINKASYRPGRKPTELSSKEKAAEELMDLVAAKTGGKAYRITSTQRLLDVFLDILGSGPTPSPFAVSKHHRTVILIGSELQSIEIDPFQKGPGTKPYSLSVKDGIDAISGIDRRITPMAAWNIVILRRPADLSRLASHWCGQWRPVPKNPAGGYKGRAYLISDFLMQIDSEPAPPWWAHEPIRVRARLAERPKEVGEGDFAVPPLEGKGISVRVTVSPVDGPAAFPVEGGQWDSAGMTYTSEPFHLSKIGSYQIGFDCVDHVGTAAIALGRFQAAFDLRSSPFALRLVNARTGKTVFEVPASAITPREMPTCQGGEQVYAELSPGKGIQGRELTGHLELEGLAQQKWPFGPDRSGRIVTAPITLPLGAKHLVGQAVAQVATPAGVRAVTLPKFRFLYDQPPPRLKQHFADRRNALWVGELHQQIVTVSILPVFQESAASVLASFPDELPEVTMHAFDATGKNPQAVPVRCRREPGKAARHTVEDGVPKVVAAYRLESSAPIPAVDHCVIDLGTVVSGLRAEPRRYAVIDPVAEDVFAWQVFQDAVGSGVAAELVPSEPLHFAAEWKADQRVSAVRFEIPCSAPDGPSVVRLPVSAASTVARAKVRLDGLEVGETYPVYVRVTCRPPEADSEMSIRLHAGQFRTERRRLRLEDWSVGAAPGTDIRCRALEELEIPLRASFAGYVPGLSRHSRLIQAFKKSCKLTVSSRREPEQDISSSIRWTSVEVPTADQRSGASCRFEGYARWTPERTGWADVQLSGEIDDGTGQVTTQTAYARIWVDDPRLIVRVTEAAGGEKTLYNSQALVAGKDAVFPVKAALATQIRINVRRVDDSADPQTGPWYVHVLVLRGTACNEPDEEVSCKELKLTPGAAEVPVEVPLRTNGEYAVQLLTVGREPSQPKIKLLTPTLVELHDLDVPSPVVPPSGRLTGSVQQWPFEYRLEIEPDWPVRAEAFQFQFQLPGSNDEWVTGVTDVDKDENGKQWLIVRSPEFMPRPKCLKDGDVQLRLRHKEAERKSWTYRDVCVVEPVLQGLEYRSKPGGERDSLPAEIELDAPVEPQFQPQLREAPELKNWWKPRDVCIHVVRNPGASLAGAEATDDELAKLTRRCKSDDPDVEDLTISPDEKAEWKPVKMMATEGAGLWGWPKSTTYAVVVSAAYDTKSAGGPSAGGDGNSAGQRQITEWSDVYRITVKQGLGLGWWLLLALVLTCGAVQLAKLAAPKPEQLGIDMRVSGGAAELDPRKHGNPTLADVVRSIANEWKFSIGYTRRRWETRGKWVAVLAVLGTGARLIAMLLFWPGRRAWVALQLPKTYRAVYARMGLIGVWTMPFWKNTGWLSGTGRGICEKLPKNGTVNIEIDLSFKMEKEDQQRSNQVRLLLRR